LAFKRSDFISQMKDGIVIDIGSGVSKAGFAGDDQPRSVFVPITAGPTRSMSVLYDGWRPWRGNIPPKRPIERGVVVNWEALECVCREIFWDGVRVDPTEQAVLLTEAALTSKIHQERKAELLFEVFHVPALCIHPQALMSMYGTGRTTGLVLELGDGFIEIAPFVEGRCPAHAVRKLPYGGSDITERLRGMLVCGCERGIDLSHCRYELARDVKEKLAYVAPDFNAELMRSLNGPDCAASYKLPDGFLTVVSSGRFSCAEFLFQTNRHAGVIGIQDAAVDALSMCDVGVRSELYANIVVSGGTSLLPGLPERLAAEVTRLSPPSAPVTVEANLGRSYGAWIGGSVFGSLDTFPEFLLTRHEYSESGPGVVRRKFA
jgi:actin-related protein